jgi:hypothetical protein
MRQWIADRHTRAATRIEIDQDLVRCTDSISHGQWMNAQVSIDRARLAASAFPTLFKPTELKTFATRIDQAQCSLQQVEEASVRYDIIVPLTEEHPSTARMKADTVLNLISTANRLSDLCDYPGAARLLRHALLLNPPNDRAITLLREANAHEAGVTPNGQQLLADKPVLRLLLNSGYDPSRSCPGG